MTDNPLTRAILAVEIALLGDETPEAIVRAVMEAMMEPKSETPPNHAFVMAERLSHTLTVLQAKSAPGYEYLLEREKQNAIKLGQAALDRFYVPTQRIVT